MIVWWLAQLDDLPALVLWFSSAAPQFESNAEQSEEQHTKDGQTMNAWKLAIVSVAKDAPVAQSSRVCVYSHTADDLCWTRSAVSEYEKTSKEDTLSGWLNRPTGQFSAAAGLLGLDVLFG